MCRYHFTIVSLALGTSQDFSTHPDVADPVVQTQIAARSSRLERNEPIDREFSTYFQPMDAQS
jgi:hypothetical protein